MTWIGVDWGAGELRAWVHSGDHVFPLRSNAGTDTLAAGQFEPALLALIGSHLPPEGVTPVICCGTVGASEAWVEAPYVAVPATPPDARNVRRVDTQDPRLDVYILAGMSQVSPPDVMRGEETRIAGFIAANPDWDGVLCLPGRHTKWAHISAGEVVSFATAMTGEIFDLLAGQSVLREAIGLDGWDADAFDQGVSDAMSRPERVAGALFSLRAAAELEGLSPATARARLWGWLIGTELAAMRPYWLGQQVALIGVQAVSHPYAEALSRQGVAVESVLAEEMTLNGLRRAYSSLIET
ncbi:2-dehydro-3-deoxygalactonokinase [Sulfitobacter sp.]|uniref:2-dehydro-3-deoxygalactonokinase n=1 Tax=Sulfitobacter sp. TaxID=1903071 RepID=UPI003299AB8D